ncbi:MAG: TetR/AcrR family transcriptional regulator [Gammaproteobacteria bacterium]|jgi:AcrR family transcriptional regulator
MNALTDNDVYWWRPLDDAEPDTRERILFAAYKEFHVNGFQSASLSRILAHTGVTKGALYHHFPNKTALGYAVVDEVIARRIQINFIEPITQFDDPVEGFIEFVKHAGDTFSMTDIQLGCPLSVLAQEMAPIDEGFRTRLTAIYEKWRQAIDDVLIGAKRDGLIIESIDTGAMAATLLSIIEGSLSAAKVAQSLATLHLCGAGMIQVLQLIRTRPDANDG